MQLHCWLNGDTDGLTGAVQEAVSKGVKVISVESGYIDGISAYFAKNDFALGSAMYMMLASEMGYQGQIICTGHTGHPAIRSRVDVQEAILKEYTGIEQVTFVTTGYPARPSWHTTAARLRCSSIPTLRAFGARLIWKRSARHRHVKILA